MLKKILGALALLILGFAIVVAFKSPHFRIERSITINAPAAAIFPQVNDLKKAQVWSPWMKLDPSAKVGFEGAAAGVGAISTWSGNNNIGEGRQTIITSRPSELVQTKLEFIRPFESACTAEFILKPDGGRTVVTWAMFGENNFFSRAICVFMDQDKMVGGPFEEGLAMLKSLVEAPGMK